MKEIDWEYWQSQAKGVRLWELVALSLNINPRDIEKQDGLYKQGYWDWEKWQYVASNPPLFIFRGRYKKEVKESFFQRLDQLNYDETVNDVSNVEIGETVRNWNKNDYEILPRELKRICGIDS